MPWWKRHSLEGLVAHSPIAVGRYILTKAGEQGFTVTPMKLLKIVYLAHGWMLGIHGLPLVRGRVEAWQYGPVFPELYRAIKHRGAEPVTAADLPDKPHEVFEPEEKRVMSDAVEQYGPLTAAALSSLTHAPNTPWELTYQKGVRGRAIPNELIEFYYREMLRLYREDQEAERGEERES